MRVKIISDSTCDLSPALLERYDIAVTPLCVIKDGKDFHDGVDITPVDIFAHVDGGGDLCSTSAVSQYEYGEMFARYANEYDAVVQITIGANFSCCYQNACAAAQEYENVFVVDSENLSTGQGLLVVAAAKLAEQGLSGAEIAERVRALAPKVEASFLIERLDYMRKGGRCSAVAALGANLLHLKPCIEVRNGKMAVCKKYRGSFEKCIRQYVKERLDGARTSRRSSRSSPTRRRTRTSWPRRRRKRHSTDRLRPSKRRRRAAPSRATAARTRSASCL